MDYDDEDDRWHEDEDKDFGCLFPGECCMPGYHFTDECHTAEMVEEWMSGQ